MNLEPNDVLEHMLELTNATMVNLTQTSTMILQMIITGLITETK